MRQRFVIAIVAAGFSLAGCSGLMAPRPPMMQVDLESAPPGADAVTSLGPGCKTPCAVSIPIPTVDFSVSFTLSEFQPMTVPLRVFGSPASFSSPGTTQINPNPVVAQLQPIAPPPKPARTPKRPKPKKPQAPA
jgi:hypothetical protein